MSSRDGEEIDIGNPGEHFPRHDGSMGARVREFGWSETPVGPIAEWPVTLRNNVETVLTCPFAMVLMWGSELTICAYNDSYIPLLGGKHPALGQPFLEVWDEARAEVAPHLERAWQGEGCLFDRARFTLRRFDQPEEAYFDYSFSPVRDADGRIRGILNVAVEVTGRVRAEEELNVTLEHLEDRVAERTEEIERHKAKLQRLTRKLAAAEHSERKRFASVLHDDVQQYLIALKMELDRAGQARTSSGAVEALGRAGQLVDEALTSSRGLSQELRPPVLYEDGLLPAVRWLAAEMQQTHDLEVTVEAGSFDKSIDEGVRAMLFQNVRELLLNVVKHAGVARAQVVFSESDGWLEISIVDRGKGFDPNTAEPGGGSLGLFAIHERLDGLGGRLDVSSAPGEGTRLSIRLPLEAVEARPGQGSSSRADRSRPQAWLPMRGRADAPPTVLVVDDHAVVRQALVTLISSDQRIHVVGEAEDGLSAVDAVETLQPDVVLMDVNMPNLNGIDATRRILARWPLTRVVGLSVQDDDGTAESMRRAGASGFVSKSNDADAMVTAILSATPRE
jgi:signal transduction histidine kinase/ActR/RegA family two-component response regulator